MISRSLFVQSELDFYQNGKSAGELKTRHISKCNADNPGFLKKVKLLMRITGII